MTRICMLSIRVAGIFAVLFAALLYQPAAADSLPSTVFCFDHEPDVFDSCAEGLVWQNLGLLDANGQPGTINAAGQIVDGTGNVLGSAIKNGTGDVIGYKSSDGSKEAYNLSAGATADQAWQRVAVGGTFHVIKHGAEDTNPDGSKHLGGGVVLDGGRPYDGFKDAGSDGVGTGSGYTDPTTGTPDGAYPLTPRPDAGITMILNDCYSMHDPDGAGDETSATDSAKHVTGVDPTKVTGHENAANAGLSFAYVGGTLAQQNAAQAKLIAAARKAGFVNKDKKVTNTEIASWLESLPFDQQYSTLQSTIAGTGATIKLTYAKAEVTGPSPTGGALPGHHTHPLMVRPDLSQPFLYTYDDFDGDTSVSLVIQPGSIVGTTWFHITQLGLLPGPAPAGMRLASGAYDFRYLAVNQTLVGTETVTLRLFGAPSASLPFVFLAGDWRPLPYLPSTSSEMVISTPVLGPIAAFEPIPPPFTASDTTRALAISGGTSIATPGDTSRLDVEPAGNPDGVVTMEDAIRIARTLAGLDPP